MCATLYNLHMGSHKIDFFLLLLFPTSSASLIALPKFSFVVALTIIDLLVGCCLHSTLLPPIGSHLLLLAPAVGRGRGGTPAPTRGTA